MRSAKFGHGTNSNFILMPLWASKSLLELDERIGRIPRGPAQRQVLGAGLTWICDAGSQKRTESASDLVLRNVMAGTSSLAFRTPSEG